MIGRVVNNVNVVSATEMQLNVVKVICFLL